MNAKVIAALSGAVFLSACSSTPNWISPEVDKSDILRVSTLVFVVECELGEAVAEAIETYSDKYRIFANQGNATAALTLTVVATPSVNGGISLGIPVGVANVTFGGTGNSTFTATRKMEVSVGLQPQPPAACERRIRENNELSIDGGLGLDQWAGELIRLIEDEGLAPTKSTYTTSFKVTNTPGGTLSVQNTGDGRGGGTISSGVSDKNDVTHEIAVALDPVFDPKKPAAAPRDVQQPASDALDALILRNAIQSDN